MKRRKVSNPLGLAVLSLLREKPMHPYEMACTLREREKEKSIKLNYGALYAIIAALEREGMIRAQKTVRDGARPERTIYALTDAGGRELRGWMRELLAVPVNEYPQFKAALAFIPALPPEEVAGLLEKRLSHLNDEIACWHSAIKSTPWPGKQSLSIEDMYHLTMFEAEHA